MILDEKIDDVQIQRIFNLRKKERLCGVGVLKRLAEKKQNRSFASTSHLAALPLLATLKDTPETKQEIEKYISKLKDLIFQIEDGELGKVPDYLKHPVFGEYDGHLLFENRLADFPFVVGNLEKAKSALKTFMGSVFGDKNKKPSPYFALLQADGDRMGKIIDNQTLKDDHKELSGALNGFAESVKTIVENHQGSLIYAGGDDVLAMLPLHTVLKCAKKLSKDFAAKFSANPKFVDESSIPPTLSVGIAVVHHTEPLQESLSTMRRAEREAKTVDGKNALAIVLSKRSGADKIIKGKWTNDRNTDESFDERLKWLVQLPLDNALPDGVAYELRDLWLRFRDFQTGTVSEDFEDLLKAETIRILKRKKSND